MCPLRSAIVMPSSTTRHSNLVETQGMSRVKFVGPEHASGTNDIDRQVPLK